MNFFWRNLLWLLAGISTLVLLIVAISIANSLPPQQFTILTGREVGAYYAAAKAYQVIAEGYGFQLNIQPTAGAVETLELLEAGKGDAGFVQGGVALGADAEKLSSLASVFYEPLWILYRKELAPDGPLDSLTQLEGMRISIGEPGSGTNQLARLLLQDTGVATDTTTLVEIPTAAAADALRSGELDAAFLVMAPTAEVVQALTRDPSLELMSLRRADALARRHRYLTVLTVPEGSIDLLNNIPSADVKLLSTSANLVVSNALHPDLLRLLTIAAVQTHRIGGIFEDRYEFPNAQHVDLPMGGEEFAYLNRIRNGESAFDRYLPFWAAALLDRYLLFVVPMILIVLPFFSRSPLLYTYLIRNQINKWYRTVREIELQVETMQTQDIDGAIATLHDLDVRLVKELTVSNNYMPDVYMLRSNIMTVIARLEWRKAHPHPPKQPVQPGATAAKEGK